MRHFVPCVEQLDRAATELHESSPVSSRLALILTDNVVELMLHSKCREIFSRKGASYLDQVSEGKYSRAAQHRVLGNHFDEKTKFLMSEAVITHQEFEFIRICHVFRGEAYHTGLTHDEIMFPLAWEYHELACRLLVSLKLSSRTYALSETYSPRFQKYVSDILSGPTLWGFSVDEQDIADSLNAARPNLGDSLQFTLAENLTSKVVRIEELLYYLANGNPFGYRRQQCLNDCQRSEDMFSSIPRDIEEGTEEYGHFIKARSAEMDARWKPRFSSVPTQSWQRRILRIQSANRYSALIGYEQLGGEIDYLLSAVESSAGALDDYVEQRIEEMRGN